jgi:hypothetical protein
MLAVPGPCRDAYLGCWSTHSCGPSSQEAECLTFEVAGRCTFEECMEDRDNCRRTGPG